MACALLVGRWAVADAHATLVSAEPAAGSRLAAGPTRVRLVFSEPMEPTLTRFSLVAAGGDVTRLAATGDPRDVHALVAPVDRLASGSYRLVWRVVSADGHPVEGSLVFSVGVEASTAAPPPPDPHPAAEAPSTSGPAAAGAPLGPALLRGVGLGSLMALAGVLLFACWRRPAGEPVPRGGVWFARRLAVAAPVLLALHLVAWLVNASPDHRLTGEWASAVLASGVGQVELWRTGLALLALWALWLARRPAIALGFAFGALVASCAAGHPAAISPEWAIPAKALHLVGGAAWLGGLLWLLVCARGEPRTLVREAARVSSVALVAAVLVTVSGVVQTRLFLSSPLDLVRSSYGAVTLAKIALLLVLVAFGAHHRNRVLPRLAHDAATAGRFAVTLRREVVVQCLVVLLGGLLAYVPTPAPVDPDVAATSHASAS